MSDLMNPPVIYEQVYSASVARVWQVLTEEDAMRTWYFPELISFKPEVGFEFVFSNDGAPYQKEWQVTAIHPERLFSHSWRYAGFPGSSEVTFELLAEGEGTRIRVTHSGLESFPADPHFARERFENGWKQILGVNLKRYLST